MKKGDKVWLSADKNKWVRVVVLHDHGNNWYWVKVIHPGYPQHDGKLDVQGGELKSRIPPGGVRYMPPEPTPTPEMPGSSGCPQCGALPPTWQPDNGKCDGCGFEKFKEWLQREVTSIHLERSK